MRPLLLAAALSTPLALAACDRGEREPPASPAQEAPAPPPPPAPPVEAPPPPPANVTATPHRSAREMRDGPGEEAAPDYAGSRGAATSLPGGDDAAPAPNSTSDSSRTPPTRDTARDPPLG